MEVRKSARRAADLPAEVWVQVASFLSVQERLSLALVCKHLYDATRRNGAALWDSLSLAFGSAAVLRSFGAWCRRCRCHPTRLALLHATWEQGGQEQPRWEEVVATVEPLLPTLRALTIRWEGEAVAGGWLRGASQLQELGLYCGSLELLDGVGSLTTLTDLSLEGSDGPVVLQSAAALPPSVTKLLAVDSHMAEVPEALSRVTALQSLYLSRNPLAPTSLSRLAGLPRLELLSLIGCWFSLPPVELSGLTTLRALYLDYNGNLGDEHEAAMQESFRVALSTLTNLEALGLSHIYLDAFPEVTAQLPRLRVLYLESNPGIALLPPAAEGVLSRLRVLSCDGSVLFSNPSMLRQATRLQHLFVSGSGFMWHLATAAPTARVLDALAALPALQKVTFVVQTQREEAPSVEVAALMLELPRRCPALELAALDSEQFYGITIADLDSMAEEDGVAAGAAAGEAGAGLRGQQAAAEVLE